MDDDDEDDDNDACMHAWDYECMKQVHKARE